MSKKVTIVKTFRYSSKFITDLRKEYNLNQEELSEVIGISQGKISKIQSGKMDLSLNDLKFISNQLKITILIDARASL